MAWTSGRPGWPPATAGSRSHGDAELRVTEGSRSVADRGETALGGVAEGLSSDGADGVGPGHAEDPGDGAVRRHGAGLLAAQAR